MKKNILLFLTLSMFFTPTIASCLNLDGDIDFQGSSYGNINFSNDFTAGRLFFSNGLIMFRSINLFDAESGTIGFDTALDTNITVTYVDRDTMRLTVNPGGAAPVNTRIYYSGREEPSSVTGGTFTYNAVDEITTITTTGVSNVVVSWQIEILGLYRTMMYGLQLFALCPLIVGAMVVKQSAEGKLLNYEAASNLFLACIVTSVFLIYLSFNLMRLF